MAEEPAQSNTLDSICQEIRWRLSLTPWIVPTGIRINGHYVNIRIGMWQKSRAVWIN